MCNINRQRQEVSELRQQLAMVNSFLKYSVIDLQSVKKSETYKLCARLVSLLSPLDVMEGEYIRVGRDFDGGYVMLNNFNNENVDAAYSFGISDDTSWDEAIARREIDVFMFDHTIEKLPTHHPRFHYRRLGVTGHKKTEDLRTLGELLRENNHSECEHLLMKMDVEGCEWDVFDEASSVVVGQFSQIVLELHGLSPSVPDQDYALIVRVLEKINKTHQCVHVHANACRPSVWIGDIVLPELLEVTYVRRTDVKNKLRPNTRRFPTELDMPTFQGMPDVELGGFVADGSVISDVNSSGVY